MGEPTGGRGEVGGGGELRLPSTEMIEGEGEGTREEAVDRQAARASKQMSDAAIASSAVARGVQRVLGKQKCKA